MKATGPPQSRLVTREDAAVFFANHALQLGLLSSREKFASFRRVCKQHSRLSSGARIGCRKGQMPHTNRQTQTRHFFCCHHELADRAVFENGTKRHVCRCLIRVRNRHALTTCAFVQLDHSWNALAMMHIMSKQHMHTAANQNIAIVNHTRRGETTASGVASRLLLRITNGSWLSPTN